MGKKRNKLGQFYLISAIILGMLVLGFFAISNYSKRESTVKLDYLKEEIRKESTYICDRSLYNGISDEELYPVLVNFAEEYINSQKQYMDLYFIFGSQNNMTIIGYQKTSKSVSITSGSSFLITNEAGEFIEGFNPEINIFTLYIDSVPYEFTINKGKYFYFILSQKINKGEHIIVG